MTQYESQYERMIKQPIPSLILTLALPTTISMLVTNIYNMADTYFVSTVGTSATGAVGIVFGLMAILQAFGFMFGHGAGANISRRLGAKRVEEARIFASTSFFGSLFFGALIAVLGLIFLNPLMYLMGSTSTILPYARAYAFFILIAAPAMTSSCVMNNILRYEGQASLAMIGLHLVLLLISLVIFFLCVYFIWVSLVQDSLLPCLSISVYSFSILCITKGRHKAVLNGNM